MHSAFTITPSTQAVAVKKNLTGLGSWSTELKKRTGKEELIGDEGKLLAIINAYESLLELHDVLFNLCSNETSLIPSILALDLLSSE